MRFTLLFSAFFMGQLAMASGWDCYGGEYHAILRNSTTAPRVPAVFVLSHRSEGTILTAKTQDIAKTNLTDHVEYAAFGPGEDLAATLSVYHLEGIHQPLKSGDVASGTLLLEEREGKSETVPMLCERYLKN